MSQESHNDIFAIFLLNTIADFDTVRRRIDAYDILLWSMNMLFLEHQGSQVNFSLYIVQVCPAYLSRH